MTLGKDDPPQSSPDMGHHIESEPVHQAIGERYLTYALSTIVNRALPDARDGLKPVHRRILYAMRGLKLDPKSGFRKCAKIVGEVMGNYHPHGDQAIYDALARLAQDFNIRYPLIQGQGNFGNIDGDNPAAQRYTEARLSEAAEALLVGLSDDAVDFRDNYDGSESEPVVLPASFPNLLANGGSGIAVGMATNIAPHNIGELIQACKYLIKTPRAGHDKLMEFVPGPDFPTGGVLIDNRETIKAAYESGRGALRIRAKWRVEELGRGAWQIVVSEIPYQVSKSRLIEKIAEAMEARKLPLLGDIRDESAEDVRIVFEPKSRTVLPEQLMKHLFRHSELEARFALNMNVLIDGRQPKLSSLRDLLRAFLDHRREVLIRRSNHRLGAIDNRLEVLEGYIVAFLNLDRVIAIIREEDEPKPVMMAEFELSDVQAEAILNMRLRALRKLEELELKKERDALMIERAELEDLLASEDTQWKAIGKELDAVGKKFGPDNPEGARRTLIEEAAPEDELAIEEEIEREPITIIFSQMGWIRAMRGHVDLAQSFKFRDGDKLKFALHADSGSRIMLAGSNGRFYTINAGDLPGGRGLGEPVRIMVDLPNDAEIKALFLFQSGGKRLVASNAGNGFIVEEDDMLAMTRTGKQVMNLRADEALSVCAPAIGDHIASIGVNRKMLIFARGELPEMSKGRGVRMQRFKDGGLADACVFSREEGLIWRDGAGRRRVETDIDDWMGARAQAGRMAPRGFPKDNRFNL